MVGAVEPRLLCLPGGAGELKLDPPFAHLVAYSDWPTLTNVYKFIACVRVLAFRIIVAGSNSRANFMGRSSPIFCLCQKMSTAGLQN
jgi:hypothetical protein